MPSNHLILCCPLLFLPSIFPSIRVFPVSRLFVLIGRGRDARGVCRQQNHLKDPERRRLWASKQQRPRKTPNLPAPCSWTPGLRFPSASCMFGVDPASSSDLNSSTSFRTQPPPGKGAPEHHPEIPSLSRFGRVSKGRMKCGRMGIVCIVWFVVYSQSHLGAEFCQMPCRHLWIWSCDFPFRSVNMIDFLY